MTKKDLFRLIIKISGLYSIITTIFSALPNNLYLALADIDWIGVVWFTSTLI
jgi:hypothetical protein